MPKDRIHREWFRPIREGGRKSCPCCHEKLEGESIWSHGNYVNAKWRTVGKFCRKCFGNIAEHLMEHKAECGCSFELVGYHCVLPRWLRLPRVCRKPVVVVTPTIVAETQAA